MFGVNQIFSSWTDFCKSIQYQISWKPIQQGPCWCMQTDRHDKTNRYFLLFMWMSIKIKLLLLLLLLICSHFSESVCWETFTYPRLLVGLGSVRARKFMLSPQVKVHVLGICTLIWHICNRSAFCPTLVKPIFFRYFRKFLVTTTSTEMTGYIAELPDIFYFQGQIFHIV